MPGVSTKKPPRPSIIVYLVFPSKPPKWLRDSVKSFFVKMIGKNITVISKLTNTFDSKYVPEVVALARRPNSFVVVGGGLRFLEKLLERLLQAKGELYRRVYVPLILAANGGGCVDHRDCHSQRVVEVKLLPLAEAVKLLRAARERGLLIA